MDFNNMEFIFDQIPLIFLLAFLSIVFIQSALDKIFNWKGNLEFTASTLTSKFPPRLVRFALLNVLLLEFAGGLGSLGGVAKTIVIYFIVCLLGLQMLF